MASSPQPSPSGPPPVESTTDFANFEGLFTRALDPDPGFADELRSAGFDLSHPEPRYPTRIWHACLEIARRRTFPALSRDEGFRRLGHLYIEGFFETILGKVIAVAMPILGVQRTIPRIPRMWKSAQPTMQIDLQKSGEKEWTLSLREPGMLPDFCAGLIEAAATPTREKVAVEVKERSDDHCILVIRG